MSGGFSAHWLALRESADHAARSAALAARAGALLEGHELQRVIDLGAGSGSNLRALAPALGPRQRWTLVDHDPALLAAARERLALWADAAGTGGDALILAKGGKRIEVVFRQADLGDGPEDALSEGADLVACAALLDLVSEGWARRLVTALAARGTPLLAVLTYDGVEHWSPADPRDAEALAAFHAHQAGDKGFGPALGPLANETVMRLLREAGFDCMTEKTPWRIGSGQGELLRALAEGGANAVGETGLLPPQDFARWRAARLAASACVIGHDDLLAFSKSS